MSKSYTHQEFISLITKKFPNLDFSETIYKSAHQPITFICPRHGVIQKKAYQVSQSKYGCPHCAVESRSSDKTKYDFINKKNKLLSFGYPYKYSFDETNKLSDTIHVYCEEHKEWHTLTLASCIKGNKLPCCHGVIPFSEDNFRKYFSDDFQVIEEKGQKTELLIKCPHHGDMITTWERLRNKMTRRFNGDRLVACNRCNYRTSSILNWKIDFEEQINRAKKVHNDYYDYSLLVDEDSFNKSYQKIICPVHGEFTQLWSNHIHLGNGCPKCSNPISKPQAEIISFIEDLGFEVEVNNRDILSPFEIDIWVKEKGIGFEFNGDYYHCDDMKEKYYHKEKKDLAEEKGIKLIHIYEWQFNNKKEQLFKRIKSVLGKSERLFARKLDIKPVSNSEAKSFCEENHLSGWSFASVRIGLYREEELVALMTFGKPRFNKKYDWELIRFCSKGTVVGGASKLFKNFKETYSGSIISYASRDWTSMSDNLYLSLGMKFEKVTLPNYVWVKGKKVLSRYQTQKKRLKNLFGTQGTEEEILKSNGFKRIWDSGNLFFTTL